MKRSVSLRVAAVVVVVALLSGIGISRLISGDTIFEQLTKFKDVMALTEKYYVDDVDLRKINDAAIAGMLRELDPHSIYMQARATQQEAERTQGSYQGVGLQISSLNDTLIVVEPMGGGPAARLGILSNDKIVRINDSSAVHMTTAQASQRLRGPKGTRVSVAVVRAGVPAPLVFEITRDNIAINSIDAAIMIDGETGYVSVNRFSLTTHTEMEEALTRLRQAGMNRLILDLRGNPGGVMQEAVRMADLFIDGGTGKARRLVYTKSRNSAFDEEYLAKSGQPFEELPIIVLINNSSASASEIVAGAIQDYDRGLVVGETSFGKGLVQRQWDFSDGSAMRLTIARYYTPSGRLIQRPYDGKDRDAYAREAFHRNEEEGDNIDHARETGSDSLKIREEFRTEGGRVIFGGGGITPDYIVKPLELAEFTKNLLRRDFFYPFIASYMDREGRRYRTAYGADAGSFRASFNVPASLLSTFHSHIEGQGMSIDEAAFQRDSTFIATRLKAYIAQTLWGNEGWYPVMLEVDQQVKRAMDLFPEARKIAGLKQEVKQKKVN